MNIKIYAKYFIRFLLTNVFIMYPAHSPIKILTKAFKRKDHSKKRGTPVSPPGRANLKRNPGVGSIPLKSIVIFKQAQRAVELPFRADSRSKSESAGTNNTVRSYLYPVNRTLTYDPIDGGGNGPRWGLINRRQVLILAECEGFPRRRFSLSSLQGNQTPDRNRY